MHSRYTYIVISYLVERLIAIFMDVPSNGCPLIIETDFDIAFNKFIAVGSS